MVERAVGRPYPEVAVKDHPLYYRDKDNLVCHWPVTFSQAALGCELEIPTLDGAVKQHLKAGVQSGDVVKIPGKGMPNLRTGRRGDLLVSVLVQTPRTLTRRQEELFRELAEIDRKNVSPERKSFFEKIRELFSHTEKKDGDKPEKG